MTNASDSFVVVGPNFPQVFANDLLVTPTGGTQQKLADALAAGGGGGSLTVTDGTHSVSSVTTLTVSGGTVGGSGGAATFAAGEALPEQDLNLTAGNSASAKGGSVNITAGNNSTGNDGGDIVLSPGSGDNNSGTIITRGDVVAAENYVLRFKGYRSLNDAGGVEIFGGQTDGLNTSAGSVTMLGGDANDGAGGEIYIRAGQSNVLAGANVTIQAGLSGSAAGGNITLTTGSGTPQGNLFLNIPDADPHVAGAAYWNAGVLTKSAG